MNDQKIDNRLKEIEDEIILLSGHLSDAVEKKIAVKIGDLKDGLDKFQKTVMTIPAKKGVPAAPALEFNKIQDDLDSIRKFIGSDEMEGKDDNLVKRIENFSGTLMKGLVNLETNMKDSVKLSSEVQDIIKTTLNENISKLRDTVEKARAASAGDQAAAFSIDIDEIKSSVESAVEGLTENLNIVVKSMEDLDARIKSSTEQSGKNIESVKASLLENLNNLNNTAVSIQQALAIDEDTTLGTEFTGIRSRINELSEELTGNSSTLMQGINTLDTTLRDSIKQSTDKQDETREILIRNLTTIGQSTDSIRQLLTIDEDKTFGTEITGIQTRIDGLSEEMTGNSGTVMKGIDALDTALRDSFRQSAEKQDETREILIQNLTTLSEAADSIRQLLTVDGDKTLGAEISGIGSEIAEIGSEVSGIGSEVGGLQTDIKSLSKTVTDSSGSIKKEISEITGKIHEYSEKNAAGFDEVKTKLQKDLAKLNDSAEIIRRMVTTDEEKFLGSMTTMIHNIVLGLSEDLTEMSGQVNNRLVNIFKNAQDNIQQNLAKQDEIKKVLLFDLYKLNDTAERIHNLCTTEEDRPLGNEIIAISDRVEQISVQMPNITEKVDKHSSQLDSVTDEVKRMRWFIVGAVVISLIVLIASFFN